MTAGPSPLDKAMRVQIDSTHEGEWRTTLSGCLDALKSGQSFSASLEASPDLFRPFFVNMVRSGEASGNLARVLTELGEYLERKRALRASVVSALTYPLILFVVAALSVIIMLGFVVPEFEALFEDMGESLPFLTRAIVALGDLIASWGWTLLALTVFLAWFLRRWLKQQQGVIWRDRQALTTTDRACRGQVRGCPLFPFAGDVIAQRCCHAQGCGYCRCNGRQHLGKELLGRSCSVIKRGAGCRRLWTAESFLRCDANDSGRRGIGNLDAMLLELAKGAMRAMLRATSSVCWRCLNRH